MNRHQFVEQIRAEIVEQNMEIYRDLFANTNPENSSDAYWKSALNLYSFLTEDQRNVLFQIIRQTMVDTTSNLLGVLDGVCFLEGQTEGFRLTMESRPDVLNQGLQDLFLAIEEGDQG